MNGEQQPPGGYPPQQGGGYPPQQDGGYPPQQGGGYPPQQGGYPPQAGGGYPGGVETPSGTPKVMGILMIIFASLGLIASLYGLVSGPKGDELPGDFLDAVKSYGLIVDGSGLLLSVLHLVAGIFALGYKAKAPLLATVYGIAALAWGLIRIVLYYVIVAPAAKDLAGAVGEAAGALAGGMLIVGAVIMAIWPILVLILMNTAKAKAVCVK